MSGHQSSFAGSLTLCPTPSPRQTNGPGLSMEGKAMITKLALFAYILLYALIAGVMWGTWLALARTMTSYDAAVFLADGQHMIANLATIMPILMITKIVVG